MGTNSFVNLPTIGVGYASTVLASTTSQLSSFTTLGPLTEGGYGDGQMAYVESTGLTYVLRTSSATVDGVLVLNTSDDPTRLWVSVTQQGGGTISLDSISTTGAMLSTINSNNFTAGCWAYVATVDSYFRLKPGSLPVDGITVVNAFGKTGFQWIRQDFRNPYWSGQGSWAIDPTNSTGIASDENSGLNSTSPLLTYSECARRLSFAIINQVTTFTCGPGDQQNGDNPSWTYVTHLATPMIYNFTPTVVYTSTVTNYVPAAFGTSAADDCEFSDTAVPGGSFTAAGALATGVLLKRTNGTVIYAPVLKDLGSTTCRVGQPINPLNVPTNVAFSIGDTYQLLRLPKITSWNFPNNGNLAQKMVLVDWIVPANSTNGVGSTWFLTCYIEKLFRPNGLNWLIEGCCVDISGGASFEGGANTESSTHMSAYKGTGTTRYSFSGSVNSEATVTTLQGSQILVENGIWNTGQFNICDCTIGGGGAPGAFTTGTGGRGHFLGVMSGKGNTCKLFAANEASQIVSQNVPIANGQIYTAASTTDPLPIQTGGSTFSATQIALDPNMNGVFITS